MYIQDKVEEYKDQVFQLLDGGAHMYFCGLKGMMPGILSMLEGVCKEKGINYEEWLEGLGKRDSGTSRCTDHSCRIRCDMVVQRRVIQTRVARRAELRFTNSTLLFRAPEAA